MVHRPVRTEARQTLGESGRIRHLTYSQASSNRNTVRISIPTAQGFETHNPLLNFLNIWSSTDSTKRHCSFCALSMEHAIWNASFSYAVSLLPTATSSLASNLNLSLEAFPLHA